MSSIRVWHKTHMTENTHKLLYDYKGAAELLSLTPAALRDLVYKGRGPVTVKIGRRTFFSHKDLEEFIDANRSNGLQEVA